MAFCSLCPSHEVQRQSHKPLSLPADSCLFSLPKSTARAATNKHRWSLLDIFRETLLEKLSRSCSCSDVSSVELGRCPRQGSVSSLAQAGL